MSGIAKVTKGVRVLRTVSCVERKADYITFPIFFPAMHRQ